MKIWVIVPVYNAGHYLRRCFDSIINQTFADWEVIAIDDGSEDNSFEIMREYQHKDKRFNIYHQENAGAGAARNYALEICRNFGDDGYIVFIDSDDYIESSYFQLLSSHTEDVVFIDIYQKDEKDKIVSEECMSNYASCDLDIIIRKQMTGCIPWGGVRKAYRAQLLIKNNIQYSLHKVGEEAVFSFMSLYFSKDVGFINEKVYSYVVHEGSLSSTRLDDPWGDVAVNLQNAIIELGEYERFANTLNAFHVSAAAVSLRRLAKKYKYKQYCEMATERINTMNSRIDTKYDVDKKSLRRAARIMRKLMISKSMSVIYVLSKVY